jgi:hypothetical protein
MKMTLNDLVCTNVAMDFSVEKSLEDKVGLGSPGVIVSPQEQTTSTLVELHHFV